MWFLYDFRSFRFSPVTGSNRATDDAKGSNPYRANRLSVAEGFDGSYTNSNVTCILYVLTTPQLILPSILLYSNSYCRKTIKTKKRKKERKKGKECEN